MRGWSAEQIWDQMKAQALAYALRTETPIDEASARRFVNLAVEHVTGGLTIPEEAAEFYAREMRRLVEEYQHS